MATSQHRCVFVGNIPYDATEEQLIEICQEVGPVVSFRLVIDRETGKPKGYGFCEYKDEETALSARRNLQGYEINGRQLRVDFAENDKGADRNREQGRGGPGFAANVDPQKQVAGSVVPGDHQPIGLHIAITAATVMEAALGGPQSGIQSNQNGLRVQSGLTHDPLTLHLAKLSRNQLTEIVSELKAMATCNKESARQLLLSRPQLPKALFQAQIMLGMVTPQVLQMPNLRQVAGETLQPPVDESQLGQSAVLQLSGLPSHVPTKLQSGLMPNIQETQAGALHHNSFVPNQLVAHPKPPLQPRMQLPQHPGNPVVQLGTLPGHSSSSIPSLRPQSSFSLPVRPTNQPGLSVGPPIQLTNSTSLTQQMHLPQHSGIGNSSVGQNIRMIRPDAGFQPGPSISSSIPLSIGREADRSAKVIEDSNWAKKSSTHSNIALGSGEKTNERASKQIKLDDGRNAPFSAGVTNMPVSKGTSHVLGSVLFPVNATSKSEVRYPEQQSSQPQLPPDVESVLLQQVLSLTPEQLSSLPPEQQQQVLQLQQALRRDQTQPS
ncbi:hypothetical protein QN277_011757 [Acacia crassicarpa]|uniref:RRM domain-containing protein n=1 Tax=Acacia crassicarpa TaxID=499986 RepID=A0AAE1TD30_9FABA|nr:hypothetical protein QN277_011757 [Acacia crassicarpa]